MKLFKLISIVLLLISCSDSLEDIESVKEKSELTNEVLQGRWNLVESYLIIDEEGAKITYDSGKSKSFLRFSHNMVTRSGLFGSHAAPYYIKGNRIVTVIEGTRLIDVIYNIESISNNKIIIKMSTQYYLNNINDKYKYILLEVEKDSE